MPKPHTFPTLFDEVKTVSVSFLTNTDINGTNTKKN